MKEENWSDDAALVEALRSLYLAEVERAARRPQNLLARVHGKVRPRAPGWSLVGLVAAGIILALAAVSGQLGHGLAPIAGPNGGISGSTSMATTRPSSPGESAPAFGPNVGGIPETGNGEPVLLGSAASVAFQNSTDDRPILVGGWLDGSQVYCAAFTSTWRWSTCYGYSLLSRPMTGVSQIGVARGLSDAPIDAVPEGSVLPTVLRVHTHDPNCPSGTRIDCAHLPVLDAIVWKGSVEPMPNPDSTRPASGISKPEAVARALQFARKDSTVSPTTVSAVDGPYLAVAPPGANIPGDQWVWAITVSGSFPAPDCAAFDPSTPPCLPNVATKLVVLDYATGSVVLAEAPAP